MSSKANIGANVSLDGEKEFKQAISGINKDLGVLGSEMKKVSAEFGSNKDSVEALTAKDEVLNKQMDTQKEKIEAIKKALENSKEQYGDNSNKTKDWQKSLNNAEADLYKLDSELKDNKTKMEQAKNPTQDMAKEVKNFGDNADKAKDHTLNLGDIIKANLISDAIVGGVKALGSAMVGLAKGIGDTIQKTVDYTSDMSDMAQRTGTTAEELQKYQYAAKMSGMETETLEKAMTKSQKSFADAKTGSKTLQESYKELGIDISKISNSGDAFDAAIKALADMKDETKRNALANDIFGKSYAQLAPLLAEGSSGIDALKQKAKDLGIVMSNDAVSSGEALGDTLDTLKLTMGGVANSVISLLLPSLSNLATSGISFLSNFSHSIQGANGDMGKIGTVIGTTLTDIVVKIAYALPQIIDGGKNLIFSFAQGINQNLPSIIDTGIGVVTNLLSGLLNALPNVLQSGLDIIVNLGNGITQNIPTLIPTIVDVVIKMADTLISNIGPIINTGIKILLALIQGIVNELPTLIQEVPRIINDFSNSIYSQMPVILKAGIDIILMIIKGLINSIPTLVANIPQIVLAIVNVITLYNWVNLGSSLITKLGEGIKSMTTSIANTAKSIATGTGDSITEVFKGGFGWGKGLISSIGDGASSLKIYLSDTAGTIGKGAISSIKSAFSDAFSIGENLIKGIWDGIGSVKDWILNKIGGFAGNIIDGTKKAFGIHSPSTVFRDEVGKNLALGLGLGFTDQMSNITADMINSIPTNFNTNLNVNSVNGTKLSNEPNNISSSSSIIIQLIADGKKIAEVIAPYSDIIQGNSLKFAGREVGI